MSKIVVEEKEAYESKTYCSRCTWEMWWDEKKNRWRCTNPRCVRYKPQPAEEPQQQEAAE